MDDPRRDEDQNSGGDGAGGGWHCSDHTRKAPEPIQVGDLDVIAQLSGDAIWDRELLTPRCEQDLVDAHELGKDLPAAAAFMEVTANLPNLLAVEIAIHKPRQEAGVMVALSA